MIYLFLDPQGELQIFLIFYSSYLGGEEISFSRCFALPDAHATDELIRFFSHICEGFEILVAGQIVDIPQAAGIE